MPVVVSATTVVHRFQFPQPREIHSQPAEAEIKISLNPPFKTLDLNPIRTWGIAMAPKGKSQKAPVLLKAEGEQQKLVAMRKAEWMPSATEAELKRLVADVFLLDRAISRYHVPRKEAFPMPMTGELVVVQTFFYRGLGLPVS